MSSILIEETINIQIDFSVVDPGQKQSWTNPGYDPEIEITDIWIGGYKVEGYVYCYLMMKYEDEWKSEILDMLSRKEDA
jgi:hypothetical protein